MLQLLSSACPLLSTVGVSAGLFYFICKTSHLLNLWYLCQLWDLSLASNQGKYRACRPVKCSSIASAEYLAGLIWWFICMYFLGSCTHPRHSWAFGTLKQQCQHPDLRGIPSRCSIWGDRYGQKAQGACAEHHQRRGKEGGTLCLLTSPSLQHWLWWDQGGRDIGPSERHDQHTEHYTQHWESEIRHEELKWQIMLID